MFLIILFAFTTAAPPIDLVDRQLYEKFGIPYEGSIYSGYLRISEQKHQYYTFYPSDTEYLILWLNGGPGCSSLQGAYSENGPFVFRDGTSEWMKNSYSWTQIASLLYIETPSFVGFSYGSDTSSDFEMAQDNVIAINQFFKKFPELSTKKFYIAGESYAGTYIPNIASQLIKAGIPLEGIIIGNGCTDPSECTPDASQFPVHRYEYLANNNFISPATAEKLSLIKEDCQKSHPQICLELRTQIQQESQGRFKYNPYNIYGTCFPAPEGIRSATLDESIQGPHVATCTDVIGLYKYLHNKEFREFLHIREESAEWSQCNSQRYTKDPRGSYYLYKELIQAKKRILIYSGDIDAVVPITGTLQWIDKLQIEFNLPTLKAWAPWFVGDQNAGNSMIIDGLQFFSIRNGGHMVPTDQRERALEMLKRFLN